ncbi:MAG: hypothetical protein QOH25_2758 [Acidobacteriota bacterium]|jgi:hypothetical protein|nr:hypothetical protein [Acidobacteriota bacterium]
MQETNLYKYFEFGYNYYWLRRRTEGHPVRGTADSLLYIIDKFFATLKELNLQVTETAAVSLKKIRKEALSISEDAKVEVELAKKVLEACNQLDATLDAELHLRGAFLVTPKRFQLDYLLKSPSSLFASEVFINLPRICQFDFTEACRCIAFGIPTAAAFHLMRGVEGVLRDYYCRIVKRNRVKRMLWYDIVNHLRQRRDAPPKALLDNLDNIRVNFRNPTQHPDARYDMDEAQDLLSVCTDAVNRISNPSCGL